MIAELFNRFNHLNILIIGDVMVDAYLWGTVDRISPEAPVPIVSVKKKELRLGGASNVALNLQALGATPYIVSVVGDDEDGNSLLKMLKNQGIDNTGVFKIKDRPTTVKTRVIGHNQQVLRIDAEVDTEIDEESTGKLLQYISDFLSKQHIDALIFEDYDKGLISKKLIEQVTSLCLVHNIPIIVDPKKRNFLTYKGVKLFKPNLKELKEGLKLDFDANNFDDLKQAVNQLQSTILAESIMVTLSEKGVYIFNHDGSFKLIPAHIRNVADVSGAGDTVISVVSACLAAGENAIIAAEIGNLAGGLVCEEVGVVPINKSKLLEEALYLDVK